MPIGWLGRVLAGAVLLLLALPAVQGQAPGNGPPPAVTVAVAEATSVSQTVSLPGRVVAVAEAAVRPRVSGLVIARHFTEGDRVEKGDSLYRIDPRPFKVALKRAEADLSRAKARVTMLEARLARRKALLADDNISPQAVEETVADLAGARADVQAARAAGRDARLDLAFSSVKAPVSGMIGRSRIQVGNLVTSGQDAPLAIITETDPVYVDLQQTAGQALRVRRLAGDAAGLTVRYHFADDDGTAFPGEGEVLYSERRIEPSTGAVVMRTRVANPEGTLLPGLFLRGTVSLGARDGVILVPQRAAVRTPDGALRLWTVGADNTVAPVTLPDSGSHDGHWIVESGLAPGTRYVLKGYQNLRPGMTVRVTGTAGKEG